MGKIVCRTVLGREITVSAFPVGRDWIVSIFGGDTPHAGSACIAWQENGQGKMASVVRPAHRDDVVACQVAEFLSRELRCSVIVNCGIHYDGVTKQEIREIVSAVMDMAGDLLSLLMPEL